MTNINHICCCCNVCEMNLLYIRCDVITLNFLDTYVLYVYINNVNITTTIINYQINVNLIFLITCLFLNMITCVSNNVNHKFCKLTDTLHYVH